MNGYNQTLSLWQNWRASNPDVRLTVIDGNVFAPGEGCLARFDDDASATKLLAEAGCKYDVRTPAPPTTAAEQPFPRGRWTGGAL